MMMCCWKMVFELMLGMGGAMSIVACNGSP